MMLAAMLAMMLVAASPAMADVVAVSGDFDDDNGGIFDGDDVEFNAVSQNVIGEINATGHQRVDADNSAVAGGDAVAVQEVDAELGVSVEVVNAGFGDLDGDGILDEFEVFDGDLDDDGIFDEFDWIILVGDFDNDGIVDDFEF